MKEALNELHRVVNAGGKLIVRSVCLGGTKASGEKAKEMVSKGFPAYHIFSSDEYCKMLEDTGFSLIKRQPVNYRMPMAYVMSHKQW